MTAAPAWAGTAGGGRVVRPDGGGPPDRRAPLAVIRWTRGLFSSDGNSTEAHLITGEVPPPVRVHPAASPSPDPAPLRYRSSRAGPATALVEPSRPPRDTRRADPVPCGRQRTVNIEAVEVRRVR
jgi:hypothetical protein